MASVIVRQFHQQCLSAAADRLRKDAYDIFRNGLAAVLPSAMVARTLRFDGQSLVVAGRSFSTQYNIHMAAFGKAVCGMVNAVQAILGDHIQHGVASVPVGMGNQIGTTTGARHNAKMMYECMKELRITFLMQ
jgi:glycerate 2-kinase